MSEPDEEYILIWEAPKLIKPEFRLYYDDKGHVICYTCENLEGKYIVIDSQVYAEARPDVRVLDGRLIKVNTNSIVSKLVPNIVGKLCAAEDVSIIVKTTDKLKKKKWKLETYELK